MSEFDKEAEREELRKKLEKEEQDREATQRMSELLLKGATMTNIHCDECGDPIFRSDGQEFCPTCQRPVVQEDETTDQNTPSQSQQTQEDLEAGLDQEESVDIQINGETTPNDHESGQSVPHSDDDPSNTTHERNTDPPAQTTSLQHSRTHLQRIIITNTKNAAESTDIQRARDHLQLAKDAAETLRTLQGL